MEALLFARRRRLLGVRYRQRRRFTRGGIVIAAAIVIEGNQGLGRGCTSTSTSSASSTENGGGRRGALKHLRLLLFWFAVRKVATHNIKWISNFW